MAIQVYRPQDVKKALAPGMSTPAIPSLIRPRGFKMDTDFGDLDMILGEEWKSGFLNAGARMTEKGLVRVSRQGFDVRCEAGTPIGLVSNGKSETVDYVLEDSGTAKTNFRVRLGLMAARYGLPPEDPQRRLMIDSYRMPTQNLYSKLFTN